MKRLLVGLFILAFVFPEGVLASTARSVVETYVEGSEVQIYQSVETTVDGQTIKKESTQPGKLELEMKKTGGSKPTVSFSQETIVPLSTEGSGLRQTLPLSFVSRITDFFRKLFSRLTCLIGIDKPV